MYLHPHLISNTDASTAHHLSDMGRQEARERSLETMQLIVINDLQQGNPQTCSAFAEYCAENLSGEVTLALCLSRIHRDAGLQTQALVELHAQVDKCQPGFVAAEVARRIEAAARAAQAEAEARRELDHA